MRIAYLTNILSNTSGAGGAVHVTQLSRRLVERGHILYTNLQNESDSFIKVRAKDFFSRGSEIDVFYIRIHGSPGNDELTLLRRANPLAPCVWEINAPLEEEKTSGISEQRFHRLAERRKKLSRMVDAAICVSDEMEKYACHDLGIRNTYVIPNGSDPELFNPSKRNESRLRGKKYKVLWAGSPKYKWQGYGIVRKLATKLREKRIDDIIIAVTAEGEPSENILYLKNVPYPDMPEYMASVDVGLCIYEDIDFYREFYFSPLKLYDYMASGLPVIGSNCGQIKAVIGETRNGLLTDNSIDDLIEKIIFLKSNPDVAIEMGNKGREAVKDRYNWDNVALQTESILLKTIDARNALSGSQSKFRKTTRVNLDTKILGPLCLYYSSSRHFLSKARGLIIGHKTQYKAGRLWERT